jgi:hypothetical protein
MIPRIVMISAGHHGGGTYLMCGLMKVPQRWRGLHIRSYRFPLKLNYLIVYKLTHIIISIDDSPASIWPYNYFCCC